MNLVTASVLLLAMLAFQSTLIYGSKDGLASGLAKRRGSKKHLTAASAKLVLATESGDVLVRAARGAASDSAGSATAGAALPTTNTSSGSGNGGSGGGKRNKNTNNNGNNKKLNKNPGGENAPSPGRKSHPDKKLSSAANAQQQQHQQQQHLHQHDNANNNNHNNNNKGNKQRQFLKSQQHQNHGKRSGSKAKTENVEKSIDGEKTQSTCRYAKSAWSDCDAKTNMRSRTLTLKKGEAHCLPTRTMQKKCKKACRYEKGSWTECSNGQMTRQDKLKSTGVGATVAAASDASCEPLRSINKKCNPGAGRQQGGAAKTNKERKNKDKASRRAQPTVAASAPPVAAA